MTTDELSTNKKVNWKQVGWFIGLTFVLSWLIDLVLYLKFGYYSSYAVIFLQLQMFIPAFAAIFLQRYVFTESPIYFKTYRGRAGWFFDYFLLLTLIVGIMVVWITLFPELYPQPMANYALLLWVLSLVVLLVIRFVSGRDDFRKAGLSFGKWHAWLLVWVGFMVFHVSQVLLNMFFNLGTPVDLTVIRNAASEAGIAFPVFLVMQYFSGLVINPLLGLVIAFGEEYGWRGYLQGELVKLGRVKGVLLVGVVWGVWHAPAIAMGHNYPGHPVIGPIAFLIFNLFLSIFLGYIVLKTGSIWLAAFGHAMLNTGYQVLTQTIYYPSDPLFAFGAGFYGIAVTLLIALVILRDPVWKGKEI